MGGRGSGRRRVLSAPRASWQRLAALEGWSRILLVCIGLIAVSTLISTATSEAHVLAWWGSPVRRQGALTSVAMLGLASAVVVFSTDESFERLVTASLLGSIGPTVYALYQVLGIDPLTWDAGVLTRASSTFGNPLFFSGYLITVWPLTLGRAITHPRRASAWVLACLQLAALVAARSLGPALALLAAGGAVGLLVLAARGRRRGTVVLSGAAVVVSLVFVSAVPARLHRLIPPTPGVDGARPSGATAAVRIALWEAAARGVSARPGRLAFGSGPESMTGVLSRQAGAELRAFEGQDTSPDRAHNDTLEVLASLGVVGLVLHVALIVAALGAALTGLGLLESSRAGRFAWLAVAALLGAVAAATWIGGGLWGVALAPPAAFVFVLAAWVACHARDGIARPEAATIGIAAVTAAWVAHFMDAHLSVETVGSGLNAAVAMAMTAGLARSLGRGQPVPVGGASPDRRDRRERHGMAVLAGWTVAVLTVGLAGPQAESGGAVWLISATALVLAMSSTGIDRRSVAVSAATWLTVVSVWLLWPAPARGLASVPTSAAAMVGRVVVLYAAAAGCLAAVTRSLTRGPAAVTRQWRQTTAWSLSAAFLVALFSTRVASADVLTWFAGRSIRAHDYATAVALDEDAAGRDPSNDRALTQMADALMGQADAVGDAARGALLARAGDALAQARAIDPFEYHHPRNLAALQRRWARRLPVNERRAHLAEADRCTTTPLNWCQAARCCGRSGPISRPNAGCFRRRSPSSIAPRHWAQPPRLSRWGMRSCVPPAPTSPGPARRGRLRPT